MSGCTVSPRDIVKSNLCIGCGSCVFTHAGELRMGFDRYGQLQPQGSSSALRHSSDKFAKTCPFSSASPNEDELSSFLFADAPNHNVYLGKYQAAYAGYVKEQDFRKAGSSGGMITWVAVQLLKAGKVDGVVHVVPTDDPQTAGKYFEYRISTSEACVRQGAKSRYYPTEMSSILKQIEETPGRYAVVGIPCFIKAIQLLRKENNIFQERIKYTLALVCGHMKSTKLIDSFAYQMRVDPRNVQEVEFRNKDEHREAYWYNAKFALNDNKVVNKDWHDMVDGDFGAGFFMNAACNFCDDVVGETADISCGDAWIQPYASDGKGNNVVVTRSEELDQMIRVGIESEKLSLVAVNEAFVEHTQAAGLRQRREGLSYRLSWKPPRIPVRKRVQPVQGDILPARKKIYRTRFYIGWWSHRVFWISRLLHLPSLYWRWAKFAGNYYRKVAPLKSK